VVFGVLFYQIHQKYKGSSSQRSRWRWCFAFLLSTE
jgi:hypothetical protein